MAESDQLSVLWDYGKVIIKEAYLHRVKVAAGFAVVSLLMLVVGYFYPKSYTTSITLFADKSNIISSLLRGQAATTRVSDQSRVVRETIMSPRLLRKVAQKADTYRGDESPAQLELLVNGLRSGITVTRLGPSYIQVAYSSSNANETYQTVNAVVEEFIRDSSDSQKSESRSAFEFIDSQVNNYREQLQSAEENLKTFKAGSEDGSEQSVERRIAQLRANIENMNLDIEGINTRVGSLQAELKREGKYANKRYKADVYRENMLRAQQHMDGLLLNYTKDHPDVVTLRYQMEDIKAQIREAESESTVDTDSSADTSINPIYENLRSQLADANVELKSKTRRRTSTIKLMEEERARLTRVAADQAELSELTRDYTVTKDIYEDMLDRKEKARLSMTLDIEGKGVNFKIQEPAIYPLTPSGLRFIYFFFAGPFIGLLIPFGLVIVYVIVDPRIRFAGDVHADLDVPLLGVVPHINTPLGTRILRSDVVVISFILLLVVALYGAMATVKMSGAG